MKITLDKIADSHLEAADLINAGVVLNKYADPTEGEKLNLTAEEAEDIAREDAGLVWFDGEQLLGKDLDARYPIIEDGEVVGIVNAYEVTENGLKVHESNEYAVPL